MSRFIIQNRLTKPEQLTGFNSEGYFFDEASSGKTSWCLSVTSNKDNPASWRGLC